MLLHLPNEPRGGGLTRTCAIFDISNTWRHMICDNGLNYNTISYLTVVNVRRYIPCQSRLNLHHSLSPMLISFGPWSLDNMHHTLTFLAYGSNPCVKYVRIIWGTSSIVRGPNNHTRHDTEIVNEAHEHGYIRGMTTGTHPVTPPQYHTLVARAPAHATNSPNFFMLLCWHRLHRVSTLSLYNRLRIQESY